MSIKDMIWVNTGTGVWLSVQKYTDTITLQSEISRTYLQVERDVLDIEPAVSNFIDDFLDGPTH